MSTRNPLSDMHGQAVRGDNVPADARQKHHTCLASLSTQPFREPVDIDLGRNVQVVDTSLHARPHQSLGGLREGSGNVQQYVYPIQRPCGLSICSEHAVRNIQLRSKIFQPINRTPRYFEIETQCFRPFCSHAPGVTRRAVNQ
ncbi:hypothetical protein Q094_05214 [Pseudomonas aeruginosa PS42]|nr:hypothetical protein Q094_05214 [Pseudomonas aeruginosa PS42]